MSTDVERLILDLSAKAYSNARALSPINPSGSG